LSLIYTINMNPTAKEPPRARVRITSRGFSLQLLSKPPDHTTNNLPVPVSAIKMSYYPLLRLRFAASMSESRTSVATELNTEHTRIRSLVCVYGHDLVSTPDLNTPIVLSLTFNQGISNFALLSLVITNIWGGPLLQAALEQ
jgi:hypothetical protein